MNNILPFLKELKHNNNREWFQENKSAYEKAKKEFESLLNRLIVQIHSFDPSIGTLSPKECIFRIYRDIRFSPDKTPYKTHFGGYIARGGRKSNHAGYYVHIDAENSFLAGGMHMPPPDLLKKIRMEIMYNIDAFKSIIEEPRFRQFFGQIEGEKLIRPPKDFPADFRDIELLKFKSYTVINSMKTSQLEDIENHANNVFRALFPFNQFLNRAIE